MTTIREGWTLDAVEWDAWLETVDPATASPAQAAVLRENTRDGKVSTLDIDPIMNIPLNVGCGYGMDPEWTHGQWKGESWVEGSVYDHSDPALAGRAAYSIADHLARVTFDGHEGWGIFEHGCIGPHLPSGFTDF